MVVHRPCLSRLCVWRFMPQQGKELLPIFANIGAEQQCPISPWPSFCDARCRLRNRTAAHLNRAAMKKDLVVVDEEGNWWGKRRRIPADRQHLHPWPAGLSRQRDKWSICHAVQESPWAKLWHVERRQAFNSSGNNGDLPAVLSWHPDVFRLRATNRGDA